MILLDPQLINYQCHQYVYTSTTQTDKYVFNVLRCIKFEEKKKTNARLKQQKVMEKIITTAGFYHFIYRISTFLSLSQQTAFPQYSPIHLYLIHHFSKKTHSSQFQFFFSNICTGIGQHLKMIKESISSAIHSIGSCVDYFQKLKIQCGF